MFDVFNTTHMLLNMPWLRTGEAFGPGHGEHLDRAVAKSTKKFKSKKEAEVSRPGESHVISYSIL